MKIKITIFLLVYVSLELFVIPYFVWFGGKVGTINDWIHFFPFDFGYYSGRYALLQLVMNMAVWGFVYYKIVNRIDKRRLKRIKEKQDIIDDIE